ncbi:unnamed protein product [Caenorhabditis bovis]|uniref:ShKT domain-containing protein n=1 Tax=Caenorhabditis bovis TaxID=2654633 RepID=A0A8S1F3K7_9PELO|nr:unnamed protein product [Caenorhabditis bovis]
MLIVLVLVAAAALAREECIDKSPYCNSNDCTVRPGYSLVYCRKTCGNCTEFCENSKFITCSDERKKDCDEMLSDYCPKLCGKCVATPTKRIKTVPVARPFGEMTSGTPKSPTVRFKPSTPRMLPNGTFINPPVPRYEKVRTNDAYEYYPQAKMEEILPEPQRIWPEPEPIRLIPYQLMQPYSTPFYGSSWPIDASGISSSIDVPRRSYQTRLFPEMGFLQSSRLTTPAADVQGLYYALMQQTTPNPYLLYPEQMNAIDPDGVKLIEPFSSPTSIDSDPQAIKNLITLLGCKDKDEVICRQITTETCLARPGYYLKLCPVKCKNCAGYQCIDSIKIDCAEVKAQGACKLAVAPEYCPRTCGMCQPPKELTENVSDCKDELDTCEQLAESGACDQEFSRPALRIYCAKTCGFCKPPQFYFSDSPLMSQLVLKRNKNSMNRRERFLG